MQKPLNYIAICITTVLTGQQTQIMGVIDTIVSDSELYKIEIPLLVRSYADVDIHDFRILTANNEQVSYFVHQDANETHVTNFSDFQIVTQNRIPDSSSTYIFKNPVKALKQVVLSIANYSGSKRLRIEGSDNQKQWFGLVNSMELHDLKNMHATNIFKILDFPLTSYRYIKLVFDDRYTSAINLRKIGTAETIVQKAELTTIPIKTFTKTELPKEKKTQLHFLFDHPQILDQIHFEITEPEFYNRKVSVYMLEARTVKKKDEIYKKYIAHFVLRSDGVHRFPIQFSLKKEFYIEIENQDNPKLQIVKVNLLQEPLYVVANLKKGEEYHIVAGDKELKKPNYDLSYFKNRISADIPNATITNVTYQLSEVVTAKKDASFWQQSWFMWTCIGFTAVLIAYFSSSLIKDMKGSGEF